MMTEVEKKVVDFLRFLKLTQMAQSYLVDPSTIILDSLEKVLGNELLNSKTMFYYCLIYEYLLMIKN